MKKINGLNAGKALFLGIGLLVVCGVWAAAEKKHYFSKTVEGITSFHTLHVAAEAEVDLMQRPAVSVRISGPEQEVRAADVHMEKDTLVIVVGSRGDKKVRVHVAAPEVRQLLVGQKAEVKIIGNYDAPQFAVTLQQHGEFSADGLRTHGLTVSAADEAEAEINRLDAHTVAAHVSGQGEIELSGLAQEALLENEGTGEIDAQDLRVQRATAVVKNKGDIKVSAYEGLKAAVFGRGKIVYKGEPVHMERNGNLKRIIADND